MRKILAFALALCLLFPSLLSSSGAESAQATDTIPEPTLNPNAEKYDEEHPEELSPDQLYALSAILMVEDTGEVIFEKNPGLCCRFVPVLSRAVFLCRRRISRCNRHHS